MRMPIAAAAVVLALLASPEARAQVDPWSGQGDPFGGQPDPWGVPAEPVDPNGQVPDPVDPYQQAPVQDGFGSFETPQGTELAPNAEAFDRPPPEPAAPRRIENPVAVFSGLDKITGRITSIDVYVDETVQFGSLQLTPRACYTAPPEEAPKTDTFVEVDEITLDRDIRRIFTGWMFADSPGLNAVEHPVYDVWLRECKAESAVPPPAG